MSTGFQGTNKCRLLLQHLATGIAKRAGFTDIVMCCNPNWLINSTKQSNSREKKHRRPTCSLRCKCHRKTIFWHVNASPLSYPPPTMKTVQVCSSQFNFPAFTLLAHHLSRPFVTAVLGVLSRARGQGMGLLTFVVKIQLLMSFFKLSQQSRPHLISIKGTLPVSVICVCFVSDMFNVFFLLNNVHKYATRFSNSERFFLCILLV